MLETHRPHISLTPRLIGALYTEALVLADEARATFALADPAATARDTMAFACESLKVTTRLMQVIAWLLNRKAYLAGELGEHELYAESRALGYAVASDDELVAMLPPAARDLARGSEELYYRVHRLAARLAQHFREDEPVRSMHARLENAF